MLYVMSACVTSYVIFFFIIADVPVVYSLNYFNKFVAFLDVVTIPLCALLMGVLIIGL